MKYAERAEQLMNQDPNMPLEEILKTLIEEGEKEVIQIARDMVEYKEQNNVCTHDYLYYQTLIVGAGLPDCESYIRYVCRYCGNKIKVSDKGLISNEQ